MSAAVMGAELRPFRDRPSCAMSPMARLRASCLAGSPATLRESRYFLEFAGGIEELEPPASPEEARPFGRGRAVQAPD